MKERVGNEKLITNKKLSVAARGINDHISIDSCRRQNSGCGRRHAVIRGGGSPMNTARGSRVERRSSVAEWMEARAVCQERFHAQLHTTVNDRQTDIPPPPGHFSFPGERRLFLHIVLPESCIYSTSFVSFFDPVTLIKRQT